MKNQYKTLFIFLLFQVITISSTDNPLTAWIKHCKEHKNSSSCMKDDGQSIEIFNESLKIKKIGTIDSYANGKLMLMTFSFNPEEFDNGGEIRGWYDKAWAFLEQQRKNRSTFVEAGEYGSFRIAYGFSSGYTLEEF